MLVLGSRTGALLIRHRAERDVGHLLRSNVLQGLSPQRQIARMDIDGHSNPLGPHELKEKELLSTVHSSVHSPMVHRYERKASARRRRKHRNLSQQRQAPIPTSHFGSRSLQGRLEVPRHLCHSEPSAVAFAGSGMRNQAAKPPSSALSDTVVVDATWMGSVILLDRMIACMNLSHTMNLLNLSYKPN